jgi:hypothetical protein
VTPFDLVFLVSFLASVVMLVLALVDALRGRAARSRRTLVRGAAGLGFYLTVLIAVSLLTPPRLMALGEKRCFDDWCIAVQDARESRSSAGADYIVTLRLSSRARARPQRERGIVVYLTDAQERRYDAIAQPSDRPFDLMMAPGASTDVTRTFRVDADAAVLSAVVAHEGSRRFPGLLIIGDEASLLHKRTRVRLR